MKKYVDKWKKKKLFDKITDVLFIVLLVALLFPSSRTAILVSVKRVIAFSPRTIKEEERVSISPDKFYWELETLEGQKLNLKDYAGKVLFINAWATWCPPCIAEMPSIQKLYDEMKADTDVVFLLITNEKKEIVQTFLSENDYDLPVFLAKSSTPELLFSPSIPTTFLISPDGEIVLREVGSKKWHGEGTIELIRSLRK